MKTIIVSLLLFLISILIIVKSTLAEEVNFSINMSEPAPIGLTLATNLDVINFNLVKGKDSNIQELTTTVTGMGQYMLTIAGENLKRVGGTPKEQIQLDKILMREKNANLWKSMVLSAGAGKGPNKNADNGMNMLDSASTATEAGDMKGFEFKINGQELLDDSNVKVNSKYSGTFTISVIAQ